MQAHRIPRWRVMRVTNVSTGEAVEVGTVQADDAEAAQALAGDMVGDFQTFRIERILTVTLYIGNKLDQAHEIAPRDLAEQFIQAVLTGFFPESPGGGGEWAYRLWLTAKDGQNASWDEADEDALFEGLRDAIDNAGRHKRGLLTRAIWGAS